MELPSKNTRFGLVIVGFSDFIIGGWLLSYNFLFGIILMIAGGAFTIWASRQKIKGEVIIQKRSAVSKLPTNFISYTIGRWLVGILFVLFMYGIFLAYEANTTREKCAESTNFYYQSKWNGLCEDFNMEHGCKLPAEIRDSLEKERDASLKEGGCK